MKKILLFSACLALVLSATAFAAETVSVALTLPDGTRLDKTVTCPENASLWYAAYAASGKMSEAGRVPAQGGKAAAALSQNAETVKIFALGADFKPLFALTLKGGSPYERGKELLASGDYAGAIAAFTDAIAAGDNAPLSYVGRGDAYIALGEVMENLAAAQADYEAALALEKTLAEAYLGVADVYIRRADYEQAKSVLQDALSAALDTNAIQKKLEQILSGSISDSSGKLRRRTGYNELGNITWFHDLSYDEQGRESLIVWSGSDGAERGRVNITYDADGKELTSYAYFYGDGGFYHDGELTLIKIVYDENGLEVRNDEYLLSGTLYGYTLIQCDDKGRKVREERYYRTGEDASGNIELSDYILREYDEKDNLIKKSAYWANDALEYYETYTYDDENKLIERRVYLSDYSTMYNLRTVYEYNESGKLVRTVTYDSNGNIIVEENY